MEPAVAVFALSTIVALALIAYVSYYVIPALSTAAATAAEYAALRDATPVLVLARDNKTVHVCINSTAQKVYVRRANAWVEATRDCRINPGGQCVPTHRDDWLFCRWYLGVYGVGDAVEYVVKGERASIHKRYTVAVLR